MTIKDKILVWIYHKSNKIEDEREELRINRRYYPMESLDLYEQMRQQIRLDTWKEFLSELMQIVMYSLPNKNKKEE